MKTLLNGALGGPKSVDGVNPWGGPPDDIGVLLMLRKARKRSKCVSMREFLAMGLSDPRAGIAQLRRRGFGIASEQRQYQPGYLETEYWMTFDLEA